MTKYILTEETKPTKLERQPNIFKTVPQIKCYECSRKFSNPGKRYEYIICPHCSKSIKNPTYDGY